MKSMKSTRGRFVGFAPVIVALAALLVPTAAWADLKDVVRTEMGRINIELEAIGSDYRLGVIEYYTAGDEQGQTVFFKNVGNKQLIFDFVPGDPRRTSWSGPVGPGDDITWTSDITQGDAGVPGGLAATQAAIASAMGTWQGARCSNLPLTSVPAAGNVGVVENMVSAGALGSPIPAADVVHAGFGTIVDGILPPPTISATFTFFFTGPTDIDNNGKFDAAFREIYHTFNFPWGINTNLPIDVETVALHEAGHGLSQAHFGELFRTDANGKFHFAPGAVMNAGYTGAQQQLAGTDNGGHCSNWGSWPKR